MARDAKIDLPNLSRAWGACWLAIGLFGAALVALWVNDAAFGDSCEQIYAEDRRELVVGLALVMISLGAYVLSRAVPSRFASNRGQALYAAATFAVLAVGVALPASSTFNLPWIGGGLFGHSVACGL